MDWFKSGLKIYSKQLTNELLCQMDWSEPGLMGLI